MILAGCEIRIWVHALYRLSIAVGLNTRVRL